MSGAEDSMKYGLSIPVSSEQFVPVNWSEMILRSFGRLEPDMRSDEERQRDRDLMTAQRTERRTSILVDHAAAVATSAGLQRQILELHGPRFYSDKPDNDRAHCEGCEFEGYEAEPPSFPCTTYELARDFRSVGEEQ